MADAVVLALKSGDLIAAQAAAKALESFVDHQGLGNRLFEQMPARARRAGPIKCWERLGRVLNFYYRDVA